MSGEHQVVVDYALHDYPGVTEGDIVVRCVDCGWSKSCGRAPDPTEVHRQGALHRLREGIWP